MTQTQFGDTPACGEVRRYEDLGTSEVGAEFRDTCERSLPSMWPQNSDEPLIRRRTMLALCESHFSILNPFAHIGFSRSVFSASAVRGVRQWFDSLLRPLSAHPTRSALNSRIIVQIPVPVCCSQSLLVKGLIMT
jgi:hypothetical protein